MGDIEYGSLSQRSALELIAEVHRNRATGSLKIERALLRRAVYFRDGQIQFAASDDPRDQLASILVEEGKLGADLMAVAQEQATPANPLARVLTELGYVTMRDLADATRVKVEKILTGLYTWTDGTYSFSSKTLPKAQIVLSTLQLLYASIRRIQERDWVLKGVDRVDGVFFPTVSLPHFISETKADAHAVDVLRNADGVKTVEQIAALSTLDTFEVYKILVGGLVCGALIKPDSELSKPNERPSSRTDGVSDVPASQRSLEELAGLRAVGESPEPRDDLEGVVEPPFQDEDDIREKLTEAEVFFRYDLIEKAIAQLLGILAKFPFHTDSREMLIEIYMDQGMTLEASKQLNQLARVYEQLGRHFEAARARKAAARL